MGYRAAGLLLVSLALTPTGAWGGDLAWEQVTVDLGAATALPVCHDFSVEDYTSSSCRGTVVAALATSLRSPRGFLLRPEVRIGGGYDTDLVGSHYFGVNQPLPLEEVRFALSLGFGYSGPMHNGEARVAGGPRLGIVDVPSGTRSIIQDEGFDVDPHGAVSLVGEFHLELDWEAGGKVRVGPRLRFAAGNQVFMMSGTECADDAAWCDDVLLLNSDVEMEVIIAFAMSLPSSSSVGFFFEAGPRLDITAYTAPQHRNLVERHYKLPHGTLEVAPWIVVGAEFRLGGAR